MPIPDHLRRDNGESVSDARMPTGITRKTIGPKSLGPTIRFHSCLFHLRTDEDSVGTPAIYADERGLSIDLVGYAIIPSEVYNSYIDTAEKYASIKANEFLSSLKEKPKKADNKLKSFLSRFFKITK